MLETAKLIKAALINNQHSEKPVSELDVLHKMVKEREKAMAIYEKAGRKDLALKEVKEIGSRNNACRTFRTRNQRIYFRVNENNDY